MCVVHDQAQRLVSGEVRTQPVEPMQDCERRIDHRVFGRVRRGRAREPEDAGGNTGSPLQQIQAIDVGRIRESRLEKLPDNTESEVPLHLRAACPKHAHAAVCRRESRRRQ